jgi:hypothetical protein
MFIFAQMVASIAVCALGGYSMYITKGQTGIGWACFGLIIVWESSFTSTEKKTNKKSDDINDP